MGSYPFLRENFRQMERRISRVSESRTSSRPSGLRVEELSQCASAPGAGGPSASFKGSAVAGGQLPESTVNRISRTFSRPATDWILSSSAGLDSWSSWAHVWFGTKIVSTPFRIFPGAVFPLRRGPTISSHDLRRRTWVAAAGSLSVSARTESRIVDSLLGLT